MAIYEAEGDRSGLANAWLNLGLAYTQRGRVDRAEIAQQLGRRLGADAGDAGNVVRFVADKRFVIHNLVWAHAHELYHVFG